MFFYMGVGAIVFLIFAVGVSLGKIHAHEQRIRLLEQAYRWTRG